MLIARAPLRIRLAGAGTDLPAYYERYGGLAVSATIDKHVYVIVSATGGDRIQVSSADYRSFVRSGVDEPASADGDLRLPRAVLGRFGIRSGMSILLAGQVPPGCGLGSSSATAVALVRALADLCGRRPMPREVADLAWEVRTGELGAAIGRHDPYAAAFGGLRCYEFTTAGVRAERLEVPAGALAELEERLLLFVAPTRRDRAEMAEPRRATATNDPNATEALHALRDIAARTRIDLVAGDVSRIGARLHESWLAQRRLAGGDPRVDGWYELALAAGASGGNAAGGGGGLLLHCEPERKERVSDVLLREGLVRMDLRLEPGGAAVVVNQLAGAAPARGATDATGMAAAAAAGA